MSVRSINVHMAAFRPDLQLQRERTFTTAARAYGPARFANRERSRDALDKLIAAHAISLGTTLVTNNMSDFTAYPELAVENWVNSH